MGSRAKRDEASCLFVDFSEIHDDATATATAASQIKSDHRQQAVALCIVRELVWKGTRCLGPREAIGVDSQWTTLIHASFGSAHGRLSDHHARQGGLQLVAACR